MFIFFKKAGTLENEKSFSRGAGSPHLCGGALAATSKAWVESPAPQRENKQAFSEDIAKLMGRNRQFIKIWYKCSQVKLLGPKSQKLYEMCYLCKYLQLNIRGKGFKVLTKKPIYNEPKALEKWMIGHHP